MEIALECQKRPEKINPRELRRQGLIPAALYGHKGAESVSLTVNAKDAQNLLKKASVNNTLVDLKIPDISWNGKALIREVQAHPWKKTLFHLSFFSVAAQESLEVVVPVNLVGQATGSKEGGVLEQIINELKVSCAPNNIPESIDIDVSNFEIGTHLSVSELILPEGVTALDEAGQIVFSIVPPTKPVEEEVTSEVATEE